MLLNKKVALDDCVMQRGVPATAGSAALKNFISPFDATVVRKLRENRFAVFERVFKDEFGLPDLFSNGGGSLSGALLSVLSDNSEAALVNDLLGTYGREAAENGCCFIRPTYGTVSRYGLVPCAPSMDQIGVLCKTLPEGFALLSAVAGRDARDGAMFPDESYFYERGGKKIKIGLPREIIEAADKPARGAVYGFAENFEAADIKINHFEAAGPAAYILAAAETSVNLSRYDGIKFGLAAENPQNLEELYVRTRTAGFGREAKFTALAGAMMLSKDFYGPYYEKAMKIRRLIKEALNFSNYDVIALPCKINGGPIANLSISALAALAGLPSVTFSYRGGAVLLLAGVKKESDLLDARAGGGGCHGI